MKIFVDSVNLEEIKKYLSWGVCDGVTTNPTVCLKCGVTGGEEGVKQRISEIAKLVSPRPVSIEVTSDEPAQIIAQAREYSQLAENIAVKITIIDKKGNSLLPTIHDLIKEGIRINVTAVTTFNQVILAAKSISSGLQINNSRKSHFISIFAGRISEEQGVERAFQVIKNARDWLDFHKLEGIEIVVGSIRSPENVEYWSRAKAHVLTIPPENIQKSILSARTKETVEQFIADSQSAPEQK